MRKQALLITFHIPHCEIRSLFHDQLTDKISHPRSGKQLAAYRSSLRLLPRAPQVRRQLAQPAVQYALNVSQLAASSCQNFWKTELNFNCKTHTASGTMNMQTSASGESARNLEDTLSHPFSDDPA